MTVFKNSVKSYLYRVTDDKGKTKLEGDYYLDSKLLHHWLKYLQGGFYTPSSAFDTVLPIFLFDFTSPLLLDEDQPNEVNLMLIDRVHQAISFPDMVVAVQINEHSVRSPYQCEHVPIFINPRNSTRPIISSFLQTLWGVLPTFVFYFLQFFLFFFIFFIFFIFFYFFHFFLTFVIFLVF